MVNQEMGNMSDMAIKFHYDDQVGLNFQFLKFFSFGEFLSGIK